MVQIAQLSAEGSRATQVGYINQCSLPWAGLKVIPFIPLNEVILPGVPEPTILISLRLMVQFNLKSFAKELYL